MTDELKVLNTVYKVLTCSYSCSFQRKKIRNFVCVEIRLNGVAWALKHWQWGHTYLEEYAQLDYIIDTLKFEKKKQEKLGSNYSPERARRVLQPPFCPNRISVSNLSPTMHICDLRIPNLLLMKSMKMSWDISY